MSKDNQWAFTKMNHNVLFVVKPWFIFMRVNLPNKLYEKAIDSFLHRPPKMSATMSFVALFCKWVVILVRFSEPYILYLMQTLYNLKGSDSNADQTVFFSFLISTDCAYCCGFEARYWGYKVMVLYHNENRVFFPPLSVNMRGLFAIYTGKHRGGNMICSKV